MKRGAFLFLIIIILAFSIPLVNADLVDWFSQDQTTTITGYNVFDSISGFFKKLFGQEQVGIGLGSPYDFNGDGCVDEKDTSYINMDINGDGNIDANDGVALANYYTPGCVAGGEETTTTTIEETTTTSTTTT